MRQVADVVNLTNSWKKNKKGKRHQNEYKLQKYTCHIDVWISW